MRHATSALDYIHKLYAPQDALLSEIAETLDQLGIAIQIGPEEGKLLQMLVRLHGAKRIVEIGTLAGYSAIWMARALPAGGHLYTINKDPEHIALAKRFLGRSDVKDRIIMLEGDAHDVLPKLSSPPPAGGRPGGGHERHDAKLCPHPNPPPAGEGIKFDMLFIDADKTSYNDYLDWAETHIRKGGLVVADNTLLFGAAPLETPPPDIAPAAWSSMRRFNERLADSGRYFTTMVPTQEGLSVAVKLF